MAGVNGSGRLASARTKFACASRPASRAIRRAFARPVSS